MKTWRTVAARRKGGRTAAPRPVVIERVGQEVLVTPACSGVLTPLRTEKRVLVVGAQGDRRVAAVSEIFGAVDDHPSGPRTY